MIRKALLWAAMAVALATPALADEADKVMTRSLKILAAPGSNDWNSAQYAIQRMGGAVMKPNGEQEGVVIVTGSREHVEEVSNFIDKFNDDLRTVIHVDVGIYEVFLDTKASPDLGERIHAEIGKIDLEDGYQPLIDALLRHGNTREVHTMDLAMRNGQGSRINIGSPLTQKDVFLRSTGNPDVPSKPGQISVAVTSSLSGNNVHLDYHVSRTELQPAEQYGDLNGKPLMRAKIGRHDATDYAILKSGTTVYNVSGLQPFSDPQINEGKKGYRVTVIALTPRVTVTAGKDS